MMNNETLVSILRQKGLKITAAESCTGGLIAHLIVSVPGASQVFEGSLVSYCDRIKSEFAGVDPEIIEKYGVVSVETAAAMAEGVREKFAADIALSSTGWAGPDDGDDGKKAGTVCLAVAVKGKNTQAVEICFPGDRGEVRLAAAEKVISMGAEALATL